MQLFFHRYGPNTPSMSTYCTICQTCHQTGLQTIAKAVTLYVIQALQVKPHTSQSSTLSSIS